MEPIGVVSESNSIEQVVYLVLHWLSVALKGGFEKMVEKMSVCARTMHHQITARSARCTVVSVVVCCVFLLSGCGFSTSVAQYLAVKNQSQSEEPVVPTQTAEPKTLGEVLEAGIGTFDPTDPNFTLFNPCTEVSQEQYEQLGQRVWDISVISHENYNNCGLLEISSDLSTVGFSIGADLITYDYLESSGLLRDEPGLVLPEGMYIHTYPDESDELACTIAVSTNRGRLSIDGMGNRLMPGITRHEVCQQAVDKFQEFLDLKG